MRCGETDEIGATARLWRRVKHNHSNLYYDHNLGRWIPAVRGSGAIALHFDRNEEFAPRVELSAYWREHLEIHQEGPGSVTDVERDYTLVFEILVRAILGLRSPTVDGVLLVLHTPQGAKPIACAHSSVLMDRLSEAARKDLKQSLAEMMSLVSGEITLEIPPGS